ncbi:MAG: hypothetical protein GY819_07260 [Planctomycetaceae bacterium]|nr:hypothetical protein [Planctomycetaceae bacterium]
MKHTPRLRNRKPIVSVAILSGLLLCFCHPTNAAAQSNPGPSLLGEVGVSGELLDEVKNGSLQAFTAPEGALFEAMAKATLHFDAHPPQVAAPAFNLREVLKAPGEHTGEYALLQGNVRRITPIKITSPKLQMALGTATYYQVDLFVSTNKTNFQLKAAEGTVVLSGTYGITLLLFDLPACLRDNPDHASISLPGFFLKNWAHKTIETREISNELRRPNPIVFGIGALAQPIEGNLQSSADSLIGWFWGTMVLLLLGMVGWQWLNFYKKRARQSRSQDAVDLSHLD